MTESFAKIASLSPRADQQMPSERSDSSNPWVWRGLMVAAVMAAFGLASVGAAVWSVPRTTDDSLPASADVLVAFAI